MSEERAPRARCSTRSSRARASASAAELRRAGRSAEVRAAAAAAPPAAAASPPRFAAPGPRATFIAEIKRRSPSRGRDPRRTSRPGEVGRADTPRPAPRRSPSSPSRTSSAATSRTSPRARAASGLPVLMKDFVVDAWQLVGGARGGRRRRAPHRGRARPTPSSRALLAAARRRAASRRSSRPTTRASSTARSRPARAIVGVNNRDLATFDVRPRDVARASRRRSPPASSRVAESGISDAARTSRGCATPASTRSSSARRLMRSPDPAPPCGPCSSRGGARVTAVKICGITREEDAARRRRVGRRPDRLRLLALSPRRIDAGEKAAEIARGLPRATVRARSASS